jgi:Tol biopolymer transport system component
MELDFNLGVAKMKRIIQILILLFTVFICFAREYKIAYNEGNKIIIIDKNGKELKEIVLPRKIDSFSFTSNKDKLVYDASFEGKISQYSRIFIYDINNKKEQQLTKGPYIYSKKKEYGNERHFAPDISPNGKLVAFVIAPEYVKNGEIETEESTEGLSILYEIGVLEIETGKFTRITKNDFCDTDPLWSPDSEKVFFYTDGLLCIYSFKNKKILLEEDTEKKQIGPCFHWINNTTLLCELTDGAFSEYKLKIYDFVTSKEEIIFDLSFLEEKGYEPSFFKYVAFLHLSKDRRYIVFEKRYKIYLIDLLNKEIKIIKELKEKKPPIYPLEQSVYPKFID